MAKFRKKPVVIEAITFDELVEYGKANGRNIVNGMPWSFKYNGHDVTHENDNCYLIPTLEGTMRFDRGDMLITGVKGEIYPCKPDIFAATYEPASTAQPTRDDGLEEAAQVAVSEIERVIHLYGDKLSWYAFGGDETQRQATVALAVAGHIAAAIRARKAKPGPGEGA